MDAKINYGGPAFPCEGGDSSGLNAHPGMMLRDWFAGQALNCVGGQTVEDIAANAYKLADLLVARGESQEPPGTLKTDLQEAETENSTLRATIATMQTALRAALAFLEEEQSNREDAGGDMTDYVTDVRNVADQVRDALGAWEE